VNYPFNAETFNLFDEGLTVFEAVREAQWWRPSGMTVTVNAGGSKSDIHYVRFARKISGEPSWPQFLVLYMDGNLRIKPQPPIGLGDTCFGSSIVIGPAAGATRPIAEIASVNYVPATNSLEIRYRDGSSGTLKVIEIDRARAVVRTVFSGTSALPLITFRSMFVAMGNADADHVQWRDGGGASHDDPILDFASGESAGWFFHRTQPSRHNATAPDIRITP
jgi:hypothetical protein